jgi:DNA-directed RNA polymerase II subunit RPB1
MVGIGDTTADLGTMAFITQTIAERKANVMQIIEDASHDQPKANPGMTIRESFENHVQLELILARDTFSQFM